MLTTYSSPFGCKGIVAFINCRLMQRLDIDRSFPQPLLCNVFLLQNYVFIGEPYLSLSESLLLCLVLSHGLPSFRDVP